MILTNRSFDGMLTGMFRSYALALTAIVPLMVLLLGSLRWGLLSMIPNLAPIAIGMGLMHMLELPLDIHASLIGSIVIGVAVWSVAHLIVNGEVRSWILFGGLGVWAIIEIFAINARDEAWTKPKAPGVVVEIRTWVISIVIFVVLLVLHDFYAGRSII